jgi:hypothetical protein
MRTSALTSVVRTCTGGRFPSMLADILGVRA